MGKKTLGFRIRVPEAREDEAAGVLWELRTSGLEVLQSLDAWAHFVAYFPDRPGLGAEVSEALRALGGQALETAVSEVDWVARFREGFRGGRSAGFRIAPAWDVPEQPAPGERLLIVDPGRAFGTGTHETTRLCLEEIADLCAKRAPDAVLDLGTGTGILGVAAKLLGAARVVAVDNDADAIASARHHAALNRVRLELVHGDGGAGLRPGSFDLVIANLTAPLLIARAASIVALLTRAGVLVLAGLLSSEAEEVCAAYGRLGEPRRRCEGDWTCLRFQGA